MTGGTGGIGDRGDGTQNWRGTAYAAQQAVARWKGKKTGRDDEQRLTQMHQPSMGVEPELIPLPNPLRGSS